jgi:hypothetical protein
MDRRLLGALLLLPAWLFAVAMLMLLLSGPEVMQLAGASWRLITYGVPLLLMLAYFPTVWWIRRRKA